LTDESYREATDNLVNRMPASTPGGHEKDAPKAENRKGKRYCRRRDTLDYLTFGVNVATLIAVVVYAYFAHGQAVANRDAANAAKVAADATKVAADATKLAAEAAVRSATAAEASNRETERSNETVQRAWVVVSEIRTFPEDQDPASPAFVSRLTIKNAGAAPAVRIALRGGTMEDVPPQDVATMTESMTDVPISVSALAPGEAKTVTFAGPLKVMQAGKQSSTVGQILYFDHFNKQRLTPICAYLPTEHLPRVPTDEKPVNVGLLGCRDHNILH